MEGEWKKRRIGDLGKVVTGKTPSTSIAENFGGNYPFITIPDLDGRREISTSVRTLSEHGAQSLKTCCLPPGAVMMSCIATIGKCGITTRPSFTNQQINSLICGADVDSKFVYYCFTQLGHALEAAGGGGSVYTNVSKSRFEEIEITVPPLAEQKAIAGVLGALDDKIELNRRMNATLEAMARALFQSWFIDFDPVRRNMDRNQPSTPPPPTPFFPTRSKNPNSVRFQQDGK
jgi:type I restriction enzyme S subunit